MVRPKYDLKTSRLSEDSRYMLLGVKELVTNQDMEIYINRASIKAMYNHLKEIERREVREIKKLYGT